MNIYFHKILPLIVSPLFLIFLIIFCGIIFNSKKINIIGIIILIFCSLPIVSTKLNSYLEKDYSLQEISIIRKADAIVVLSGMVSVIQTGDKLKYEFGGSVDRILAGIDLFKFNKAPFLILTRGKLPWQYGIPEGEYLKDFAIKFGIPKENILLTDIVQNTEEEAKSIRKILKINNPEIILVTSVSHMYRAQNIFEAVNIKVIPFAVDFKPSKKLTFLDFIPSADALGGITFFLREMIGRLYYNMKYKI
tara:strand:- start:3595 stop:4341 length:747 start_codon:yes stop_codon:yes gene_type:complete